MEKEVVETKICKSCNREKVITQFSVYGRKGFRNNRCKICVNNKVKVIKPPIEPDRVKTCRACNIEKPIKLFYVTKNNSDGYSSRCKKCMTDGVLIKTPKERREKVTTPLDDMLRLDSPRPSCYRDTYKFLQSMNYDVMGDIHLQFCERHNLTPITPRNTFKNHMSAKQVMD